MEFSRRLVYDPPMKRMNVVCGGAVAFVALEGGPKACQDSFGRREGAVGELQDSPLAEWGRHSDDCRRTRSERDLDRPHEAECLTRSSKEGNAVSEATEQWPNIGFVLPSLARYGACRNSGVHPF